MTSFYCTCSFMTRLPAVDTVCYFTRHKSLTVCERFREQWITDIAQMSPCINRKPRFVIFCKCYSCSAVCEPQRDGKALMLFLILFLGKWSVILNVLYQQMVDAALISVIPACFPRICSPLASVCAAVCREKCLTSPRLLRYCHSCDLEVPLLG